MAIATPSLITSGNSAAGTTATTASVTLTAGRLYLLGITGRRADSTNVPAPNSVVRGAQSFTIVDATAGLQQYDNSSSSRRALWVGYCVPASDTTGTIVATWSASLSRKQWALVEVASGFDSGTPIQQVAGNLDASELSATSLTATFGAAISSGGAVVGFFGDAGAGGITPGDDYTELVEVQTASEIDLSASYDLTPDTTFTCTFTAGEAVGAVAVEIKAAAAGGQPTQKRAGGVPWMGQHGAGFPSAIQRWIRRESGLQVPAYYRERRAA